MSTHQLPPSNIYSHFLRACYRFSVTYAVYALVSGKRTTVNATGKPTMMVSVYMTE